MTRLLIVFIVLTALAVGAVAVYAQTASEENRPPRAGEPVPVGPDGYEVCGWHDYENGVLVGEGWYEECP